jgi:prepilin-type N-terminal cleavage/methylation domain-containing protein
VKIPRCGARRVRPHSTRTPQTNRDEAGFTLIELLVVVIVIPLIMGAIADAFIVSLRNNSANSNRISDSVNAQLAQDYFVRDVQSASYITECDNNNSSKPCYGSFTAQSPQVCTPASGTLLVALYHSAVPAENVPALDVAYWLEGSGTAAEVDRYSCTLNTTTHASTSPVKTAVATQPPSSPLAAGQTQEAITASVEIDPSQFASAASNGWTSAAAFTTAEGFSGGTLTVSSSAGFASGPLTIVTSAGLTELTGCSVASSTTFTGCSTPPGTVANGDPVTQSNISSVHIAVAEPASQYAYNLLGAPRASNPQSASNTNLPNLLTLGPDGIAPVNGGGNAACPDSVVANICIGTANAPGGVVVDTEGIVYCNGAGVHDYVHFQNGDGTVGSTAPEGTSTCNSVAVAGSVPTVPDPLKQNLPNNGCMPASITATANPGSVPGVSGLTTNPATYNGNAVPGIYTSALSGTLEPGIYILEGGIGSITGMAPDSGLNTVYYGTDSKAGVLLFVPSPPNTYSPARACFNPTVAPTALNGSVSGIVPLDASQSASYFNGDSALGDVPGGVSGEGVWLWQDTNNTNAVTLTGYSSPPPGGTNGGLLYTPGADYVPPSGGPGSLSTGAMIIAGTNGNGTHLSLCLNWTYTSSC